MLYNNRPNNGYTPSQGKAMKKILIILSLITVFQTVSASVIDLNGNFIMDRTHVVNLKEIKTYRSIQLSVSYPGELSSGVCSLELRSSWPGNELIEKLLTKVSLRKLFSSTPIQYEIINGIITIPLLEDTYVDGIGLTSLTGEPISKIVADIFGNQEIVAVTKLCK